MIGVIRSHANRRMKTAYLVVIMLLLLYPFAKTKRGKLESKASSTLLYGVEFVEGVNDETKGVKTLAELNVNLVLESFYSTEGPSHWSRKLEAFKKYEINVIAWLIDVEGQHNSYDGWYWNGGQWVIKEIGKTFLDWAEEESLKHNSNLIAIFGLEEPYWTTTPGGPFKTSQLQMLYRLIKSRAPHVKICMELSDMDAFDKEGWRGGAFGSLPEYQKFDEGDLDFDIDVADYAGIWFYPFVSKYEGEAPTSYINGGYCADPEDCINRAVDLVKRNYKLVREKSSNTKLIFLAQAFSMPNGTPPYRMPEPREMELLAKRILSLNMVSGLMWYCWDNPCVTCGYEDWLSKYPDSEYWDVVMEIGEICIRKGMILSTGQTAKNSVNKVRKDLLPMKVQNDIHTALRNPLLFNSAHFLAVQTVPYLIKY